MASSNTTSNTTSSQNFYTPYASTSSLSSTSAAHSELSIPPSFVSVRAKDLSSFFQDQAHTDPSCLQWMLLSLCNNDTDFFNKLRHELFNLLIIENSKGIREINKNNVLNFASFLKQPKKIKTPWRHYEN